VYYETIFLAGIYGAYKLEEARKAAEQRAEERIAQQRDFEDKHLLPLLSADERLQRLDQRFREDQERSRQKEEERRHQEILAVERRKANAIEELARQGRRSILERLW
jgi:hypothetical protein